MAVPCGRRALSATERRQPFAQRLASHRGALCINANLTNGAALVLIACGFVGVYAFAAFARDFGVVVVFPQFPIDAACGRAEGRGGISAVPDVLSPT